MWMEKDKKQWLEKAEAELETMEKVRAPALWQQIMDLNDQYAKLQRNIGRTEEFINEVKNAD